MLRRAFLFAVVLGAALPAGGLFAQAPAKSSPTPTVAAPQPSTTPTTRSLIDSMDAADLKEAIQLLKNNYIKPESLNETELSRAAFEGVLTRLGRGVILLSNANAPSAEPAAALYGEVLDGHVGYLRLGALHKANLEALDSTLQNFATKKVDAVVLDFRASGATNDLRSPLNSRSDFARKTNFCSRCASPRPNRSVRSLLSATRPTRD